MQKVEITPENVDELVEQYADEWMAAKGIYARFVKLTAQMVRDWSKNGEIRRRPNMGPGRHEYEFNVADAIVARARHTQVRAFLRREVDGIEFFRCNRCEWWTGRGGYYKNTVPSQHGLLTTCITCHLERGNANRDRSAMAKKIRAEKARERRAERQAQVRQSAAFKPKTTVDSQRIIDMLEKRLLDVRDSDICRRAQVHEDMVRNIRRRAKEGKDVKLSVVDELFTGLSWTNEIAELHHEAEEGRPPWHPDWPYCQMCLRANRTYMARGLCSTCYKHRNDPSYRPMSDAKWAMRWPCCRDCHTTERKHIANGRCGACDARWRKRQVGSGHAVSSGPTTQEQATPHRISGRQHRRGSANHT